MASDWILDNQHDLPYQTMFCKGGSIGQTNKRRSLWISADILSWCVSVLLSVLHVSKQNSHNCCLYFCLASQICVLLYLRLPFPFICELAS